MKNIVLFIFLFISPVLCFANHERADTFSLPLVLMQATFKIEKSGSTGTCFILTHQQKNNPENSYFVLITAKHVLDDIKGDYANIHLRKKVGTRYERLIHRIQIRKDDKPIWVSHPTADVAALHVSIPKNSHIFSSKKYVSTALLADDTLLKKHEVQPGDELMVLGYPLGAESNQSGFPILRSGRIASYPLVPSKETKTFLMDFEIFRGNSGGPVFLFDRNRFYDGEMQLGRFRLVLGLVSKEKGLDEKIKSLEEVTIKRHRLSIAEIVHASLIRETVELLFPEDPIPEPTSKKDDKNN